MPSSDRPFSRKLVRLGFQMLGRDRAHRQDVWPGLAIDRPLGGAAGAALGRATWRGRPLLTLAHPDEIIPSGLPLIAVVGSGPSLKSQRVEALGDGTAILCNGAASLTGRIRPMAVAVEDERFVFRHLGMLAALPAEIPLLLSPAAIRAWAQRDLATLTHRKVALIDNLQKPVGGARRALTDPALRDCIIRSKSGALSVTPQTGVVITGTVAFTALQFALAAAPRAILLAGVDLTNDSQPRFYETADRAPSGLTAGIDRILGGFALARDTAARRSIALTCASPVSALLGLGIAKDDMLT